MVLSLAAVESGLLSLLHHRFNFWGWPWDKQLLLVLLVAPAFAYVVALVLVPIWSDLLQIGRSRWMLFLLPALGIGVSVAWHFLSRPEVQHRLEIIASKGNGAGDVQLAEIRAAYGELVPLSTFRGLPGWALRQGILVSVSPAPSPIEYAFNGPIDEQARITFLGSPGGRQVGIVLDGQRMDIDLAGQSGHVTRIRLDTQYRWGFLNFLILPLVLLADTLTAVTLLAVLWLMQEVTQKPKAADAGPAEDRFPSHARSLLIVGTLAAVLHAINFLSVPLAVFKDSPSYLQGAVYWIQNHSLDGVSSYRGLGTTLLFAPVMAVFGRSPYALKLLLHLLAIGCVPLSYRLGWQLGRWRWFAFCAALMTALLPDLYTYSSYVLSDGPHVVFGLLFCTLLITALQTLSAGWILAALLAGAFATLVRTENVVSLLLGAGFILLKLIWLRKETAVISGNYRSPGIRLWQFAIVIAIAASPLAAWSAHNRRVYGFFGLSDYAGATLYDGWIYFGANSQVPIADHDSPAVRAIDAVYQSSGKPGPAEIQTSWTIYRLLLQHGYSSEQAFSLLQRAALESIRGDLPLTWKLLLIKFRQGFEAHPYIPITFLFPGESYRGAPLYNSDYFDEEHIFSPPLIYLQRFANRLIARTYQSLFTVWFWVGLTLLFICLYRRPFFDWVPLVVITANSIFLPTIMGMSMWRYVLLGIVLMQSPVLAGVQSAGRFIPYYWRLSAAYRLQFKLRGGA